MADIQVEHRAEPQYEDATMMEIVLWIIGILMIPLVPIVMVALLTPHTGM